MPYIKQKDREKFQNLLEEFKQIVKDHELTVGDMNFFFSSMIWHLWDKKPSYTLGSNLRGMLHDVSEEFYRRKMVDYENAKINENGDI